ncbi:MAG TPA: class I SAM-dependent methyltransferase [Terriglobia bacterium]|nr:class I SAM-dependent methyltransferase [Terriglobia bacterium]
MSTAESDLGSESIARAFDTLAETYDDVFTRSQIGRAQRAAVHRELDRAFRPGQYILEINCGTGVDAVHLGRRGVVVIACDASPRMIQIARQRTAGAKIERCPEFLVLPIERIATLAETEGRGRFDGAFSNFAGLNCVMDLSPVAQGLAALLKPGATLLLCVFGRLCAWEILWYLMHGKPRKAFRRLHPDGDRARLAGDSVVHVHYPAVPTLVRLFAPHFRLKEWKGVGVAVPPTYLESVSCRFPRVFVALREIDRWAGSCPVLRGMADHVLLRFERTKA